MVTVNHPTYPTDLFVILAKVTAMVSSAITLVDGVLTVIHLKCLRQLKCCLMAFSVIVVASVGGSVNFVEYIDLGHGTTARTASNVLVPIVCRKLAGMPPAIDVVSVLQNLTPIPKVRPPA